MWTGAPVLQVQNAPECSTSDEHKERGAYLGVPGSFPGPTGLCVWPQKQSPSWKAITQAPFLGLLPGKTLTSHLSQRHSKTKSLPDPTFLDSGCCLEVVTQQPGQAGLLLRARLWKSQALAL